MTKNISIPLNINDKGNILIDIPYNNKVTFNYILEIISYNFPDYDICPCFKFQYKEKYSYYGDWKNIDTNQKVSDFSYGDYKFKITNKKCTCCEVTKDNYKNSKIEIINTIKQKINIIKEKKK